MEVTCLHHVGQTRFQTVYDQISSRAVSIAANVQKGDSVLITGIGGGVALVAFQLCIAKGANVYVTSGNAEKIKKAMNLGAKGGVNYKSGKSLSSSVPRRT